MCTGVAYWGGIRQVVYAVPKSKVSGSYYEIRKDLGNLTSEFNEPIEMLHVQELEHEALSVIKEWEEKVIN